MRSNKVIVLLLFALAVCLIPIRSRAANFFFHGGGGRERGNDLTVLSSTSNLVFVGRVIRVDYRLARRTGGGSPMPHAIVTYQISRVLRGTPPGRTISLRFMGGSDNKGHFLSITGVPAFQTGDE